MSTPRKTSGSGTIDLGLTLQTLKQSGETVADPSQDIRGRDVLAKDGEKIGKVDALVLDDQESKIRFMRVEAGGFLGIGEKKWLMPVDAITRIDKDHVYVDQTRDKIVGSPVYDPDLVSKDANNYYRGVYDYYGYGPYWMAGYRYPLWW
jgi:sporulation protein YlmC with PRC-barrel domain